MLAEGFRLCEPVAIPPVQVPEPVEEDFQQKEIFSLLKEATDLRRQQQRLEMQISQAQDANASLQSSWSALSRVSTTLAFGSGPSPKKEGDAPWPEDRLEKGEADVSTAAPLEGSEVLVTSQLTLAREAHDAALRLREAEAAVSTLQADAEALEKQSRLVEEEVQEMAGPLKELEALREEGSGRAERLEALKSREEATLQALSELSTKRLALQEAAGKLQAELQETSAKELPQVAKRRREADLEAQRAQQAHAEAQSRWKTEVQMCQSALQAEEKQLARLLARKESTALAAVDGQQACSVLSRSLADVRQEHARLLGWKQDLAEGRPSDLDPFGLRKTAAKLGSRIESLQLDIERLKGEVGTAEAELRKARAHEAATVEADRLRTVVLSSELTAFQVCSERLFRLSRNMEDKTESLQTELQRELISANDLRQTLMAAFEANVSEVGRDLVTAVSKPLLHSESAPELNPRPAPATWKDVMERHGCPPEQSISVRMHRRRKKQNSTPAGAPQRSSSTGSLQLPEKAPAARKLVPLSSSGPTRRVQAKVPAATPSVAPPAPSRPLRTSDAVRLRSKAHSAVGRAR